MTNACFSVSPTKNAPTKGIKKVTPQVECNLKKCETTLNLEMFFDGTNNNKDRDSGNQAHTNIARLHDIYSNFRIGGHIRIYIPGVGTRFPEIGEYTETRGGTACAFGCEARVIFGLLAVFNALHRCSYDDDLFDKDAVRALCRNNSSVPDDYDSENLAKHGIQHGLLQPDLGSNNNRQQSLKRQANQLRKNLANRKPHVVEVFLDVFGFSRGAAQARVF